MSFFQSIWNFIKSILSKKADVVVAPSKPLDPPIEVLPVEPKPNVPLWYEIALKELGQAEIPGRVDNQRIVEYQEVLGFGDEYDSDSNVAWCACFVAWALKQAGVSIEGVNGLASSFDHYGHDVKNDPPIGAIVTFRWDSGHRHVGIFAGWLDKDKNMVKSLGGNQHNEVNISTYASRSIVALRMPSEFT